VGTAFDIFDEFRTWNEFHGADVGLQLWTHAHGWTIELSGKLGLGAMVRTVDVAGETLVIAPASTTVSPGGLLTAPSNIGRSRSARFSVLPELTVRLRHPLSRFFTITAGYTVLIASNVARTGDQIDMVVNTSQLGNGVLVGDPRPARTVNDSTLWVHGFTVGLEW